MVIARLRYARIPKPTSATQVALVITNQFSLRVIVRANLGISPAIRIDVPPAAVRVSLDLNPRLGGELRLHSVANQQD
jgi:hypothetical protein